jgi:hypothetical protein
MEIDRFLASCRLPAQSIMLRNGVGWYSALLTRIALAAVGDEAPQRVGEAQVISDRA